MRAGHLLVVLILGSAGCVPAGDSDQGMPPLVNLQVTELDDHAALEAFVTELDGRQIKATLMVAEYMATEQCDQLRRYHQSGHEIMVYGRPESPTGERIDLTMLSLEEQQTLIGGAKSALEDCLGESVTGFRSYLFAHNENTWRVLDALGFEYNLSYVAHSSNSIEGHEDDEWPYEVPDHTFWAVPIHSAELDGQTKAFCDMPFSEISAEEWEALLKGEFDQTAEGGLPLKVLFHSYFSANDAGRWEAFRNFLDYAESQGAAFVTVEQLMGEMSARVNPAAGGGPAKASESSGVREERCHED